MCPIYDIAKKMTMSLVFISSEIIAEYIFFDSKCQLIIYFSYIGFHFKFSFKNYFVTWFLLI